MTALFEYPFQIHYATGDFYLVHHAGHFLQDDAAEEVAAQMIRFLRSRTIV